MSDEKKKDIEMQMKKFLKETNTKKTNNKQDKPNVIKLLGGPNRNIPALSKFVKMKYSESMGRCLVVSSDINPGKWGCGQPYSIYYGWSYAHVNNLKNI